MRRRSERVLHPTDFSRASAPAFTRAVEIARAGRGELILAHVLPMIVPLAGDGDLPPKAYDEIERTTRAAAARRLAALAARARKRGVRVRTLLLEGAPWEAIVRAARRVRASGIVMGTHGRGGLAKLFLGSVAERVVARASCPVTTVRG
jgi:nucleotide-binding universal stress UspA family protein